MAQSAEIAELDQLSGLGIGFGKFHERRIHIQHITTAGGVEILRRYKARGVRITGEASPHHFTLTDDAVLAFDTNAKMNPPLREAEDIAAIKRAIADGTIDCIATDHAPHPYDAKEQEFDYAPFGVVGLETALGLGLVELVDTGVLTLPGLLRCLSSRPAELAHLPAGTLKQGAAADVTIFDPDATWTVDPAFFFSKSRNTPFTGRSLRFDST